MKKKKALLFPYDISLLHMATNHTLLADYEIVHIVSLKSWGYCNKDAGTKAGVQTGLQVSDDFEKALNEVDTVIIADTNIELKCELMDKYIKMAQSLGKEIVDERKSILENHKTIDEIGSYTSASEEVLQIKTVAKPVIAVVGTGENTGKFDVQLYIRQALLNEGYKITQIGSKSCCKLWGFHGFPDFMTGCLSGAEKIIKFNHYVNSLASSESSDIIIIGVPGGVAPISSKLLDDFGIMNYLVANAIKPDYVVLNTNFVDYNTQYIETMVNSLKFRLNYEVDSVFLSNFFINWEATDSFDKLVYMTLPAGIVDQEAERCGCYSVYNAKAAAHFKRRMLATLVGYGDFETI